MSVKFTIYCDFDGTVTTRDTVDFLLERLADSSWQHIETLWEQGKIGSRECMARQIPLLRGGWKAIESVLSEVSIDPTFPQFAQWCARQDIPLVLVSEGLDRVIQFLLEREAIHIPVIWANHLQEDANRGSLSLSFPHAPSDPTCQSGLCKCKVINQTIPGGNSDLHRIVIGDGLSDRCWAQEADILFAKSKLMQHCQNKRIPFIPFDNFDTIRTVLEQQLRPFPKQNEVLSFVLPQKSAGGY